MFDEIFYTNVIHQGGSMLSSQIKLRRRTSRARGKLQLEKSLAKKTEMVARLNESERNPYENNA